jgi:diaminohydroxyphosphoribosylaminopyrimidine deaminase / 5-amino-6-(5-phosphoribosylamino)uracil reductase
VPISDADRLFLAATVRLAENGMFTATPNPRVGSILVKDGVVLGRGWHRRTGGPHAEIEALHDAAAHGHDVAGATCYVSLEPCAHHGRTPPCADALIDAGIARVVAAMADPFAAVRGQGFRRLDAAGIVVERAELAAAHRLNMGYVQRQTRGTPWVRLKMAVSVDGRTALASGASRWITSPEARADVQYWRARSCAIVTGIGTVLADDPALTVRDARFADERGIRQPLRVVLDSGLRTPASAQLFATAAPILVVASDAVDPDAVSTLAQSLPAHVDVRRMHGARPDLADVIAELARRQCNEILFECGATLAGELLRRDLWDELVIYVAPRILGSSSRPLADIDIPSMADVLAGHVVDVTRIGPDVRLRMFRQPQAE